MAPGLLSVPSLSHIRLARLQELGVFVSPYSVPSLMGLDLIGLYFDIQRLSSSRLLWLPLPFISYWAA